MRQKDLMLIIVAAVVTGVISLFVSNAVFAPPKNRKEKVPVVEKISADFPDVNNNSQYQSFFNVNALNPTQLIKIGDSNNEKPFNAQ
mgnify:CR=1 FL=1